MSCHSELTSPDREGLPSKAWQVTPVHGPRVAQALRGVLLELQAVILVPDDKGRAQGHLLGEFTDEPPVVLYGPNSVSPNGLPRATSWEYPSFRI